MHRFRKRFHGGALMAAELLALAIGAVGIAPAHATHKVYGPVVEDGEAEIELRGHYNIDSHNGVDGAQEYLLGAGRAFTDYWASVVYAEITKTPDESLDVEAIEWENLFQFNETGEWKFGLLTEFEFAIEDGHPDALAISPLLQTHFGEALVRGNLIFEREFGDNAEDGVGFGYSWQVRFPFQPTLEWGLEGYGSLGELADIASFHEQTHEIGPGLFGELEVAADAAIEYRLVLLFGLTDVTPDERLVFGVEYAF